MNQQPLPTVRIFAPEQWGEIDRFVNLHAETYRFHGRDARALSGVRNHFQKSITLQSLAVKLRIGLNIDEEQLEKRGYTAALNSHELSAVIEASILELYSSLDCAVKVLRVVYGHSSRSFPESTRKLFNNFEKITGSFPDTLKQVFRKADWYNGLLYIRDELTHLATGSCTLDHKTGNVRYLHMGMKLRGSVYIIDDIFMWLADTTNQLNSFLGMIFHVLNLTLKSTPVQQTCGFVEGRILLRYLDPTEPLTFNSGQCFAYQWFERPENPTCPFVETCGAYQRKMLPKMA
jgi:hypothetical protein